MAGMLLRAANDLPLSDAQRATLAGLDEPTHGEDAVPGTAAALKTGRSDLAAGIRAGKVDMAAMQLDYAAIDKAGLATATKQAEALAGLHAALQAPQRQTVVDAVRARQGAHEPPSLPGDAGTSDWTKHKLERMTAELGLDAGQQKAVAAPIAKDPMTPAAMESRREAMKKRTEAVLAAFATDAFDAKKVDLATTPDKTSSESFARTVSFDAQLVPLLRGDQREKLAARAERPSRGPRPLAGEEPSGGPANDSADDWMPMH